MRWLLENQAVIFGYIGLLSTLAYTIIRVIKLTRWGRENKKDLAAVEDAVHALVGGIEAMKGTDPTPVEIVRAKTASSSGGRAVIEYVAEIHDNKKTNPKDTLKERLKKARGK